MVFALEDKLEIIKELSATLRGRAARIGLIEHELQNECYIALHNEPLDIKFASKVFNLMSYIIKKKQKELAKTVEIREDKMYTNPPYADFLLTDYRIKTRLTHDQKNILMKYLLGVSQTNIAIEIGKSQQYISQELWRIKKIINYG